MLPVQLRSSELHLSRDVLHSYFFSKPEPAVQKSSRKPSVDSDTRTVTVATATDNDTWSLLEKTANVKAAGVKREGRAGVKSFALYGIQEKAVQTEASFIKTMKHSDLKKLEGKALKRARPERNNRFEEGNEPQKTGLGAKEVKNLKINKVLKEDS
eukprot:TRINITY_DN4957_c0_g3_i1.p1 TRINITY_DN4957_c0_g3~~TRINITY_DN4957_c0_g3_i1.p1  ORF type:complete len:156 (+),score=39.37 TRINITY_DN4957_c0_g3_i1:117-584(+)